MWWREVVMPATFKSKLGDDTLKLRSAGYSRTSASDGVEGLHVTRSCLAVGSNDGSTNTFQCHESGQSDAPELRSIPFVPFPSQLHRNAVDIDCRVNTVDVGLGRHGRASAPRRPPVIRWRAAGVIVILTNHTLRAPPLVFCAPTSTKSIHRATHSHIVPLTLVNSTLDDPRRGDNGHHTRAALTSTAAARGEGDE